MKRRKVGLRDEPFDGYKQELSCGNGGGGEWRAAPGGVAQKVGRKWAENVDFKFKKIDFLPSTIFKLLK